MIVKTTTYNYQILDDLNKINCVAEYKEYKMTEIMIYDSDIKEEIDEPEDTGMRIEKHKFSYDWLQNEKTHVKNVTGMDSMSFEGSYDREDDQQSTVKLNDSVNELTCKQEHTECIEGHTELKCNSEIVKVKTEILENVRIKKEHKLSFACLRIVETEDRERIFICDRSSSETDCGNDHRKYDVTEKICNQEVKVICDSDIVKVEMDGPEYVKIETGRQELSYTCLDIGKREETESTFTGDNSSKANCVSEDSKQVNVNNKVDCDDERRKYVATERIIVSDNDSEEEVINLTDVKMEIDVYTQNKTADAKISNRKEIMKCISTTEKQNIDRAAIKMDSQDCGLKIKDKHHLKKHFDRAELYKCQHCEFETKWKHGLNKHFKQKHDDSAELYICEHCEFETKDKYNLKRHFRFKHDDSAEWHKCQHCEFKTKDVSLLKKHFIGKHDDTTEWYKCEKCEFKAKRKGNLKQHFQLVHDDSAEWYKCQQCEFKTKRKGYLNKHFKKKHNDNAELYKCAHCEFETNDEYNLKRHFKFKHDYSAEWYECQHCEFKTKRKQSFTEHFKKKHDDSAEWYKCEHCEFKAKCKSNLKRHFKWKHDDNAEWYKCQHCEFKTKRKYYFNEHLKKKHMTVLNDTSVNTVNLKQETNTSFKETF